MSTSWTRLYHDLKSLKADADLVAVGHITSSHATAGETPPATDFQFSLDTVLHKKGAQTIAAGSSIAIHQTGGVVNGQVYVVQDDPRFKIGEKDLVFLTRYEPGRYFVLGGPSGRFQIGPDGLVRPINDEGVALAPTTVDAMEALVASG